LRGRGSGNGYVKRGGVHEHRLVMQEKLGRRLSKDEVVHHVDGDKRNNAPENLEVITWTEHMRIHGLLGRSGEGTWRRRRKPVPF